jgi:hypothetical protein
MAKAKKTAGQTAPTKSAATINAAPEYKTLTVKHDKTENVYRAYDEKGKEYTADDCPRQIMMHLAHKAGEILYFRGKKWRRKKPDTKVTVTATTTPSTTTKASETVTA